MKVDRDFIDSVVALKKFQIELSNSSREEKEQEKLYADLAGSVSKMVTKPVVSNYSYNFSLSFIMQLKACAQKCALKKLVAFPIFARNGNVSWMLMPSGGDTVTFLKNLGSNMKISDSPEIKSQLESNIKNYGVVIYESDE